MSGIGPKRSKLVARTARRDEVVAAYPRALTRQTAEPKSATLSPDGATLKIRVPLRLHARGGRKLVSTPDGSEWRASRPRIDSAIVKALARAFRWRKLLETGAYATIEELAEAEKINPSYVSRVLRMTLLAPAIVEAILDGKQAPNMQLDVLLRPMTAEWSRQIGPRNRPN